MDSSLAVGGIRGLPATNGTDNSDRNIMFANGARRYTPLRTRPTSVRLATSAVARRGERFGGHQIW